MTNSKLTLVAIGPRHAGKTVYLAALMNSRGVLMGDSETKDLLKNHWDTLKKGECPKATAGTISDLSFGFLCNFKGQDYNFNFSMPDYDGFFAENLGDYKNNADIGHLREELTNADGFIVFMPVGDEDSETIEALSHEIKLFIGTFKEEKKEKIGKRGTISTPLIIAVNKWDKSPHFKAADEDSKALEYVKSIPAYNRIYETLCDTFENVTVLPVSAYGHRTEAAEPVAGAISPWRVTEPVLMIVQKFFSNLDARVKQAKEEINYLELASTLLSSREIWTHRQNTDYSKLLKDALNQCAIKFEAESRKAHNFKELLEIEKHTPEMAFFNEFTPDQQLELKRFRQQLANEAKKENTRRLAVIAGIILVVLMVSGSVYYFLALNKAYTIAMNADVQKQYALLHDFLQKYETSMTAKLLFPSKLSEARKKYAIMTNESRNKIENAATGLDAMEDSCARAQKAAQLIETAKMLEESIPLAELNQLQSILEQSQKICALKAQIKNTKTLEQTHDIGAELATLPSSAEVIELRTELARLENAAKYDKAANSEDLFAGLEFIQENKDSEHGRELAKKMASTLQGRFFNDILSRIKSLDDFSGENFADLQRFVSMFCGQIALDTMQRKTIAESMQKKIDDIEIGMLRDIPDVIATQRQLVDAQEQLNQFNKQNFSLDGGLFEYDRPKSIRNELDKKLFSLKKYFKALDDGLEANWGLYAANQNSIDIDCSNAIGRDSRVSIVFENGIMVDKNHGNLVQCRRVEGDRGYLFTYMGKVHLYDGLVRITKNVFLNLGGHGRDNRSCSAHINITPDDIIKLVNHDAVQIDLSNNCHGLRLDFSRR